jgi:hypothetical protein
MSNPLESLKLDYWYKAVLVISTVLLVISLTVPLQGVSNSTIALICLGGIFIGLGEWVNHPLQEAIGHGYKITGYPRKFTFLGSIFVIFGLLLACCGVSKLLA